MYKVIGRRFMVIWSKYDGSSCLSLMMESVNTCTCICYFCPYMD